MFLPSRQRRLNLAKTPDRVGVQSSLTRRGNNRQPSRGLKPTAKFKAPRCGGGICEVKAGKQTSDIQLYFVHFAMTALATSLRNGQSGVRTALFVLSGDRSRRFYSASLHHPFQNNFPIQSCAFAYPM